MEFVVALLFFFFYYYFRVQSELHILERKITLHFSNIIFCAGLDYNL